MATIGERERERGGVALSEENSARQRAVADRTKFDGDLSVVSSRSHRDCAARPRRTLVWLAIGLAISPLLGAWLVDNCPLHIRFPDAAALISSWKNATPAPNILILGSSRLGSFVRTADLSSQINQLVGDDSAHLFNSSVIGGEPITLEFLTKQFLETRTTPPRLAVLEINLDLLARDNMYYKLTLARQLTARDLPIYLPDIFLHHDGVSRLLDSRLTPFFFHRSHLLPWAEESFFPANSKNTAVLQPTAFTPLKEVPASDERLRDALHRIEVRLRHYQLAGATSASFERTVAMLHAKDCKVVLLQPPLSSAQRALFTASMQAQYQGFIERLYHRYGFPFLDYSDRLPDSMLADNHHANQAGSILFTELLANEVIAPAWRKMSQAGSDRSADIESR